MSRGGKGPTLLSSLASFFLDEHPSLQFTTGCFYTIFTELRCTLVTRESSSRVPRAVAPGAFLHFAHSPIAQHPENPYTLRPTRLLFQRSQPGRRHPMAEQPPSFQFEDVPLDEARRM